MKNSQAGFAGLGVFLCLSILWPLAQGQELSFDITSPCYSGYSEHPSNEVVSDEYLEKGSRAEVPPAVSEWLRKQGWNERYAAWKRGLRCGYGIGTSESYGDSEYCGAQTTFQGLALSLNPQIQVHTMCSSKTGSLAYLAMHKHLLQSVRALWPDLQEQFSPWMMLPEQEDYPENIQPLFKAWPDKVMQDTMLLSSMRGMSDREVFLRWPDEGDLVHWMLCGSTEGGMNVDSLYGALMTNMVQAVDPGSDLPKSLLEQYLFWKIHAWLEMHWNMYRMRKFLTPLEPELQADIITQCEIFEAPVVDTQRNMSSVGDSLGVEPVFVNGKLNPEKAGQRVQILGKVKEVIDLAEGQSMYRLDLPLMGVQPLWVSSYFPIKDGEINVGDSYNFIGFVTATEDLDRSGQLRERLQTNFVLMAQSIQSPK